MAKHLQFWRERVGGRFERAGNAKPLCLILFRTLSSPAFALLHAMAGLDDVLHAVSLRWLPASRPKGSCIFDAVWCWRRSQRLLGLSRSFPTRLLWFFSPVKVFSTVVGSRRGMLQSPLNSSAKVSARWRAG